MNGRASLPHRERRAEEARERAEAAAKEKAEREARERERRAKWRQEGRQEGRQFTVDEPYGFAMTMKWCPAGTFTMGSPSTEEGRDDDEIQHQVTLTRGFWMGETEVTQGQWRKIMDGETIVDLSRKALLDDTEYVIAGKKQTLRAALNVQKNDKAFGGNDKDIVDQLPVYWVNWYDAVEFCNRLTQRERKDGHLPDGYEYRLPTEAEWEYSCRANTTAALPNGMEIHIIEMYNAPALDNIAWYGGNSSLNITKDIVGRSVWVRKLSEEKSLFLSPQEVKGKQPNAWGLYDMIGNISEWCGDWVGDYSFGSEIDPTGMRSGTCRVIRGGNWNGDAHHCRSAARSWEAPYIRYYNMGFRVALAPMLPEEYRKAIQKELQRANVGTRHEQYPVTEVKRERQAEQKAVVSTRNEKGAHDKVQLWEGGPYWADRNVGAERPEDYGYYFWWGDTVGYTRVGDAWVASDGSSQNFSFNGDNAPTFRKDGATLKREGWITDDGVLTPEHDAAQRHWGGSWRMPTKQELEDLNSKCDWKWTTRNGVNGYEVRGRGIYASASIFLPCAGNGYEASLIAATTYGRYLSSGFSSDNSRAWSLGLNSDNHWTYGSRIYTGQSVRPVQGFTK